MSSPHPVFWRGGVDPITRRDFWEMIYEAQRLLNEERLFITLAGPHQIQAYRNDRFVFPEDVTHVDIGLLAPEGVLYVEVVK